MSTIDDIRGVLAAAAEPMATRHIAEALELDGRSLRGVLVKGAEAGDEGAPPARAPVQDAFAEVEKITGGASSAPAPVASTKPGRKPKPQPEPKAKAARVARAPKAARKPKTKRAPAKRSQKRVVRVEAPGAEPALAHFHTIMLPRQTVRLLVAGVLAFGGELGGDLRAAVLEATKEAA